MDSNISSLLAHVPFLSEMQRIAFRFMISSCVSVCLCVCVCVCVCLCVCRVCGRQENV